MGNTSIQISEKLQDALKRLKFRDSESYEDIIWDLLEDSMELSEETKKNIALARKEMKEGKGKSLAQVKKELGI